MDVGVGPGRRLSTQELMLLNRGAGEDFCESLKSPLDSKEIKPVNPKRNQLWIFVGRMLKLNTLAIWCEKLTHRKRPWCWERLKAEREGDDRGWDGWMASPTNGYEFEQTLGDDEGQGSLTCCSPCNFKGRVRHHLATEQQQFTEHFRTTHCSCHCGLVSKIKG